MHCFKHPFCRNLHLPFDAIMINMNGAFGILVSVLNRKIFYVFVLSHAGAEHHRVAIAVWSICWSGLCGSDGSWDFGKQQRLQWGWRWWWGHSYHMSLLLCVCDVVVEKRVCLRERETIRDYNRGVSLCFPILSVCISRLFFASVAQSQSPSAALQALNPH